jgi:hypothetical protein
LTRLSLVWKTKPEESIEYCKVAIPLFGSERVPVNITDSARVHTVEFVVRVKVGVGKGVGEGVGVGVGAGEPKA